MSTVLRAPARVNSPASPANSPRTTSFPAPSAVISAVAWHALLKTSDKEACRDDLIAGESHLVNLCVSGDVDGQAFAEQMRAVVSVGHDSTRASSATPDLGHLIGAILSKLNEATREAILRDLPEQYAAAGCQLPEVSQEIADKTDAMLKRLRAKRTINVRGSVSVKYCLADDGNGTGTFTDGGERVGALAGC
jgi:hypothetical protein